MDDDHGLAAELARETGELLVGLRASLGFVDPRALRAAGDRQAHELLIRRLGEERPSDVVLSEEAADPAARLSASRVWIVDPLDGTREFGEQGRTDWAVHVALWVRESGIAAGRLAAGAVALPAEGVVLSTADDWALPREAGQSSAAVPRVVMSRTRPPVEAERVQAALGGEALPLGSVGAKVAAVIRGEADVYVHSGGQYQWDSAAPVAVALAAGLHASRLSGEPLVYNGADLSVPDLVVCRADLALEVLAALRGR